MRPTSTTAMGREHEEFISKKYGARRSRSSGANPFDKGDLRFAIYVPTPIKHDEKQVYESIGECKCTKKQSISIKKSVWDKIKQEAVDAGRIPHLFLRFVDENGKHTDLVVREVNDDLELLNA